MEKDREKQKVESRNGGKPSQARYEPGASQVIGRGLGGASQVHARYMRDTCEVQARYRLGASLIQIRWEAGEPGGWNP
jgi:hypothetical protein